MHEPMTGHSERERPAETRTPTSAERLDSAQIDLDNIKGLLEQLWLQRHMLYAAIRELKIVQRNLDLAKKSLASDGGSP